MDAYIDARFERLETALSNLIGSVAKYNPSIPQAEELKAADWELTLGLRKVETHQNNHLRIKELRRASASLDAQIRDVLTTLAAVRKDILDTPITTYPPGPRYPIHYDELLAYARRISKTTLPPAVILEKNSSPTEEQTPAQDLMPPASTPSVQSPAQGQTPFTNGDAPSSDRATRQSNASVHTSLPEGMSQYLNPLSGQIFFPWPTEDKLNAGALATYNMLVEQGIDPEGYDPVVEERKRKEEEERKAQEEREKEEREKRERQLREEREKAREQAERQREKEQEEWRRASIAHGQPDAAGPAGGSVGGETEKKQFQFASLDDLDGDDEEG